MRFKFDSDLHIHSRISLCSGDERQTSERILQYAKDNGLKTVCITDHFWDESVKFGDDIRNNPDIEYVVNWYREQNFEHISASKPLPQADGIKFLFGCETEMLKDMTLGISKKTFDKFDFVVIPTTHFHMKGFTIADDAASPAQKADFWFKKLNALLDMDLPFGKIGIAHLTCGLMDPSRDKYLEILSLLDRDRLSGVFKKAARCGVGIELNSDDMDYRLSERETVLAPYRIAKESGCKFYFGSDAHHPEQLEIARMIFERAIDDLELDEKDKFVIWEK